MFTARLSPRYRVICRLPRGFFQFSRWVEYNPREDLSLCVPAQASLHNSPWGCVTSLRLILGVRLTPILTPSLSLKKDGRSFSGSATLEFLKKPTSLITSNSDEGLIPTCKIGKSTTEVDHVNYLKLRLTVLGVNQ